MNFFLPITAIALILLSACTTSRKSQRGRNEEAPIPSKEMAQKAKVSLEEIGIGYGVYMRKCGECHTHLLPDEVTSQKWHVIVPGMAWNAGIDKAEEQALVEYLLAAKKSSITQ